MEQKKEFKSSGSKGQKKNQSKSGPSGSQSGNSATANFTSEKYSSNLGG